MFASSFRSRIAVLAVAAVLVVAPALPAAAQSAASALPDKYEFVVGGFNATFSTLFGLKLSTSDDVPVVDFEEDLGAPDRNTMFRGSAAVRFGRHQFRAGYYKTSRESTTQIDRQIVWGDQVFDIGATVGSEFSTSFPAVDYTYWLFSSPKVAVGATLGVTLFGVEAGVNAAANSKSREAQVDTSAIVPLFGGELRALPANWLVVKAGGGYINDFSGTSVWRLGAGVEPRIYKSLWLGVAFDAIKFNVSKDAALFDLNAAGSYRVAGVQFYARIGF
jgi:hypothetical protein